MSFHPAYPSASDLHREADARDRDQDDLAALRELHVIVAADLAQADQVAELRHPDAGWHVSELLETLRGELVNIHGTAAEISNKPLCLESAS
jgi:hypothetical protein